MEALSNFIHLITTVEGISDIIRWGGLMLLILIVFAETGLLVGFFSPEIPYWSPLAFWPPPQKSWTSGLSC